MTGKRARSVLLAIVLGLGTGCSKRVIEPKVIDPSFVQYFGAVDLGIEKDAVLKSQKGIEFNDSMNSYTRPVSINGTEGSAYYYFPMGMLNEVLMILPKGSPTTADQIVKAMGPPNQESLEKDREMKVWEKQGYRVELGSSALGGLTLDLKLKTGV
jgi:hypothetical protein